jgi:hypothetical protein
MEMNKNKLHYVIMAVSMAVFVVLGLSACASTPKGPPPIYKVNTKPVAEGFLQGKKVVFFDIKMAERSTASLMSRQGSGGIFSLIQGASRMTRLALFNSRAKAFDKANETNLLGALKAVDELVATVWQNAYNAETVHAAYDFGKVKPMLYFFNRPNAALKKEIARICAENNAELAVTIIQQVTHGYMAESDSGTGGSTAITQIVAEICVYDKTGTLVIQASTGLPYVGAGLDTGFNFAPNNGNEYSQLYLDGAGNILAAILTFDSSTAFSLGDLMAGFYINMVTTKDEDE